MSSSFYHLLILEVLNGNTKQNFVYDYKIGGYFDGKDFIISYTNGLYDLHDYAMNNILEDTSLLECIEYINNFEKESNEIKEDIEREKSIGVI